MLTKSIRILFCIAFFSSGIQGQTISQLGQWNNNANFVIKYHQDRVITSTTSGIQFMDVSDPTNPQPSASLSPPNFFPMAIEVDGNYAYFGGGMFGYFMVADISNINFPIQVGLTNDITGTAYQLAIAGNYAYMPTNSDTLYILDIANKTNPNTIAKLNLGSFASGITVQGSYAFIGTTGGLKVVDVSNPYAPVVVNSLGSGYGYIAKDVLNQRIFVSKSSGFDVFDISNPTTPTGLFQGIGAGTGGALTYWNNHIYQVGSSSVSVFSIASNNCMYMGSYDATFAGQVNGVTAKDSVFYVSTVNNLHVLKYGTTIVGVSDVVSTNDIIYNNPIRDVLQISARNSSGGTIKISNSVGQVILTDLLKDDQFEYNLSHYPAGIYFLEIRKEASARSSYFMKMGGFPNE